MRRTVLMAAAIVAAVTLAGCGSSGDDDAADVEGDFAVDTAAASDGAGDGGVGETGAGAEVADGAATDTTMAAASEASGSDGSPPVAPGGPGENGVEGIDVSVAFQPADLGRDIVFIGNMTVAVDDVSTAAIEAQTALAQFGALVFGQQTTTAPEPRTTLIFKVRPADFSAAMVAVAGLGDLASQDVTADDVTERVVDLESQILTAETSVERLRGFLADATDLTTITQIEQQLLQRETDLETLRGQLRTIQSAASLATINVTLVERVRPVPAAAVLVTSAVYAGHDEGEGCVDATEEEIDVDADELVTMCLTIANIGATDLAEIQVDDSSLGLGTPDYTVVAGDVDAPLPPDSDLVLAYELTAAETSRSATTVSVTPVDAEGVALGAALTRHSSAVAEVSTEAELPGFREVLADSWSALLWLGAALLVLVAAVLPFLWLLVIGVAVYRWRRRRTGVSRSVVEV